VKKLIKFVNLSSDKPYSIFKSKYEKALEAGQKNIDAISISSYCNKKKEIDSRFVNLKFVENNRFIFFTNYDSKKASDFNDHDQIAALVYWPSINTQIRIKAKIKKTSVDYNISYFKQRAIEKNALAISSNQSKVISSYDEIITKYKNIKNSVDLLKCPDYWGGFVFLPYEIEFWEGNESRLNKRNLYKKNVATWNHFILEP
jgi:pyridoxamine 5'-phosphate oxidase